MTERQDDATREGRCPRCGKKYAYRAIKDHKPFPFCSDRCRDVDLGNWLTEQYVVPGQAVAPPPETADNDSDN